MHSVVKLIQDIIEKRSMIASLAAADFKKRFAGSYFGGGMFAKIKRFWIYRSQLGMWACFMNIAGNVIAFMPCGYLIPAMFEGRRSFADAVFIGFMVSFIIECTQLVFKVGSFDVDDLLLNTIGAALGYIIWLAVHRFADIKVRERQVRIREIEADE